MVALKNMGWLSELSSRKQGDHINNNDYARQKSDQLGILAFETAKTMSLLVSLYKSLSYDQISRLTSCDVIKSQGVRYLNSTDEGFLLGLACAERLEDLDKTATAVARLGQKCRDLGLRRFDLIFTDLKLGIIDFRKLVHGSKHIDKKIHKMEKLIGNTASLYTSLEALAELEISERKLSQWKDKVGPMTTTTTTTTPQIAKPNFLLFKQKLEQQRKQVQHLRQISLWSKTFDKSVRLMARIVCFVYARLCDVFGPYLDLPILSSVSLRNLRPYSHQKEILNLKDSVLSPQRCILSQLLKIHIRSYSGPIPVNSSSSNSNKLKMVRFYSRKSIFFLDEDGDNLSGRRKVSNSNRVFHAAGPSTVGGSGLALRYANVILLAESCLYSAEPLDAEMRESLYQMLPENIKSLVKSKLSKNVRGTEDDELLAAGWREALRGIMGWLAPMAHNTLQWHLERNPEKMKFDLKPTVLLLQTLHFSDKDKTEAAIAEVLVSLSCIFKHENCISCSSS